MKYKLIPCPTCHTTGCVYNDNPDFPYPYAQCKTCNGNGYMELEIKQGVNCANISDKKEDKYCYSLTKCGLCGRRWVAVFPEDTEKLECPTCHNITQL